MATITLTLNINEDELRNIRNTLTALQGKDVLNESEAEAVEGLLTLTDTIKDAVDNVQDDSKCPHCGGEDIDWGEQTIDGSDANQEAHCQNCQCHWVNVYKFKESQIISN
jgi:predicted Zn-ribbon and HTH transcriptional regulator